MTMSNVEDNSEPITLNTGQRLALNLDSHIVIDAGAGTGKTMTIVERVVQHYLEKEQRATRLLPRPERPRELEGGTLISPSSQRMNLQDWEGLLPAEVVLLTFTVAAADQMRDKLRKKIARLQSGSFTTSGEFDADPRITHEGFPEQLLMLLEDAPIGTIDSFFNQLVSPYRSYLGDEFGEDVVTESEILRITEQSINTLWRLPNSPNLYGDAVDAGIPSNDVEAVLAARDRITQHYSGRNRATSILNPIISKSIFISEGERGLLGLDGSVDPERLQQRLMTSIRAEDIEEVTNTIQSIIEDYVDCVRSYPGLFPNGWEVGTRIHVLSLLSDEGPPAEDWERLIWLSRVFMCIVGGSLLKVDEWNPFPGGKLPNHSSYPWRPGIESYTTLNDPDKSNVREIWNNCHTQAKNILGSDVGQRVKHHSLLALILDSRQDTIIPANARFNLRHLPDELPERLPSGMSPKGYSFNIEAEARNLDDIRTIVGGLAGIVDALKEREEVHEHRDIALLAGDLLLDSCPRVCRTFYPEPLISALDSIGENTWRDDHIHRAFVILDEMEANPELAGDSASNLAEIRRDLEHRYQRLRQIRRRYRAFIIDEAQDNSPLQWRILSRLWGPREYLATDELTEPDTDWQPTVCYVGDMKQSIYAFRQAEVAGFRQFAHRLRSINRHEYENISELTREPVLRSDVASRDPRFSHGRQIVRASQLSEENARNLTEWIHFETTEGITSLSPEEVTARSEGEISLTTNYRTEGELLHVMNEWWEDIFSDRHRFFPDADYYASAQRLLPSPAKENNRGTLEWICPVMNDGEENPPTELTTYIDPFESGKADSNERQAMMIAKRIQAMTQCRETRVMAPDGNWVTIPAPEDPVRYSDIMVLMASRSKIRDALVRHLRDHDIPVQADREGGLMERPVVADLDGLIQFIARPNSKFAAAWVARSSLIGMSDAELQSFLDTRQDENLMYRLIEYSSNPRQIALVQRWIDLSSSGRIIDLLLETIDQSDLLTAHCDEGSIQDVERFIDEVRSISDSVGRDAIVIADRLRDLREQAGRALEAKNIPERDAVQLMTIHNSKGLESKVVFVTDLFSAKGIITLTNESQSRLIVSPEFFAGHPAPWPGDEYPISAMWEHAKKIAQKRKNAEARRLLYVAATRAEEHLVIVGSPDNTSWQEDSGLHLPWRYSATQTTLGQMWIESLRQASHRRGETSDDSPWMSLEDDNQPHPLNSEEGLDRILNPGSLRFDGWLRAEQEGREKMGINIYHNPHCLISENADENVLHSPLVRQTMLHEAATDDRVSDVEFSSRLETGARIRLAPHRLSKIDSCPRRNWFETRGGLKPDSISSSNQLLDDDDDSRSTRQMDEPNIEYEDSNLPSPTELGLIVHRMFEVGIGNPGPSGNQPSMPLPTTWANKVDSRLLDSGLMAEVFDELLPRGVDREKTSEIVAVMLQRIEEGHIGRLSNAEIIDGERVEGLRTEYPFTISNEISFESVPRTRWTPDGEQTLANIANAFVDMDGSIDLVLCSTHEDGSSSIRPIDLKTEQAESVLTGSGKLLDAYGDTSTSPANDAELDMLEHHRLQLALYHRALEKMEASRPEGQRRRVERPAILVGVSGRLVIYPEEMFATAQADLDKILATAARMELITELPLADFQRRPASEAHICKICPFSRGDLPICGPLPELIT